MFVDNDGEVWLCQDGFISCMKYNWKRHLQKGLNLQDLEVTDGQLLLFYGNGLLECCDVKSGRKLYQNYAYSPEDGATYYRNYSPLSIGASDAEKAGQFRANRTPQSIYKNIQLKRLQDIRVFSDFEPRTEDSTMFESILLADATVELVTIPNDGVQPTFRDRHIVFHGISIPEQFYQPDYSRSVPTDSKDYRRTLYWNPNAMTDEQGRFTATFYNNGKQTRIKMSAAGVTNDGRLLHSK
jgi:hypothetical protein